MVATVAADGPLTGGRSLVLLTFANPPGAHGLRRLDISNLGLARSMRPTGTGGGARMLTCRCGGFLRLDLSHISEAQRFGCLATTPLLWKCCLCGRSRWLEQSTAARSITPVESAQARAVV